MRFKFQKPQGKRNSALSAEEGVARARLLVSGAAGLYFSFQFKFCQILALKINHGKIWEPGISPLFQDLSKIGNGRYFIIVREEIYIYFILLGDWHPL